MDADDLNAQQKLSIASKIGLSETAFISSSNSAAFKLDFFAPTRQIAHCGHATIATFSYGIKEESAIGMAAGPLACFLHDKMKIDKDVFLIEQGHLMTPASPGLITAKLNFVNKKNCKLMVGGEAKAMKSMTISI